MVSVVTIASAKKQKDIDHTLPLVLGQQGVDLEVVLVTDSTLKVPNNDRLRVIRMPGNFDFIDWFNTGLKAAKGNVVLIYQPDMEINNPRLLRNMLDKLEAGFMVSEQFFKKGKRTSGIWCQLLMLYASDLAKAGYYHEGYKGLVSFEDSDLMATLMENGLFLKTIVQDEEYATFHIDHPTNYDEPQVLELIHKARKVYESRHAYHYQIVYAQMLINMRRKYGRLVR